MWEAGTRIYLTSFSVVAAGLFISEVLLLCVWPEDHLLR